MSQYHAIIKWTNDGSAFVKRRYSRAHEWQFDGGVTVPASASPHVVPLSMSSEAAVDPEEAFIAALSSCHMLFFLDFASRAGIAVDRYVDNAEGVMENNDQGKMVMTRVTLNPQVEYNGVTPGKATVADLHHKAHKACFLANSVKTEISVNIQAE